MSVERGNQYHDWSTYGWYIYQHLIGMSTDIVSTNTWPTDTLSIHMIPPLGLSNYSPFQMVLQTVLGLSYIIYLG